jgi:hypothetical protein
LIALLRGIWHRRGLSAAILAVAVVAVAASAIGPIWYSAAATSLVRDTVATAPSSARFVDVTQISDPFGPRALGGAGAIEHRVKRGDQAWYAPTVRALEYGTAIGDGGQDTQIVWRDGFCRHLVLTQGRCPTAPGDVLVSTYTAHAYPMGTKTRAGVFGQRGQRAPRLHVVGVYRPRDVNEPYWAARGYFGPVAGNFAQNAPPDAIFTGRGTFVAARPDGRSGELSYVAGHLDVTVPLAVDRLSGADAEPLRAAVNAFGATAFAQRRDITVDTTAPTVLTTAINGRAAFSVPLVVVTLQLLVLCWLLLFLVTSDAVEARGPEIALAKLRGMGGAKLAAFGLAEPIALLAAAWPLGVVGGWAVADALGGGLLRTGTGVTIVATGWLAGLGAACGGLVAAGWAARGTLARPVTDQWRRTGGHARRRGWALDAALLALAAAALIEMVTSGGLAGDKPQPIALLTPGIVGVAIAVLASRLLPPACRALNARTRRGGGIGAFLAVRQIARRPGGARTTIVLATAFALATYAVAAWEVAGRNYGQVAQTNVGAADVLTVAPRPDIDVADVLGRVDPSGRKAVAVDAVPFDSNDGNGVLAVDTARFANVAHWRPDFASRPLRDLMRRITPKVSAKPVRITGDRLRVRVAIGDVDRTGGGGDGKTDHPPLTLTAVVHAPGATAPTPVTLGTVDPGRTTTLTAGLPSCAAGCTLHHMYLELTTVGPATNTVTGSLRVSGFAQHVDGAWKPLATGVGTPGAWREYGDVPSSMLPLAPDGSGLKVTLKLHQEYGSLGEVGFGPDVAPDVLPAVATPGFVRPGVSANVSGPDGQQIPVRSVAAAGTLPWAGGAGLIIDRRAARNVGTGIDVRTMQQVWTVPGAATAIAAKLKQQGVPVVGRQNADAERRHLTRQGPGLALVLMLTEAAAAALLAVGGAILTLYATARRRGYELAALDAAGAPRRALRAALLIEQAVVLGFGSAIGFLTGWIAALLTLRSIPEFAARPIAPPLAYQPSPGPLILVLAVLVALVAAAVVTMSSVILRRARAERLREAPA